jgi:hypothetical protein
MNMDTAAVYLSSSMSALSPKQITIAQAIIDATPPGEYELKQIYGTRWDSISSPTKFGKVFKAAVQAGALRNIRVCTNPKTNNHHLYVLGDT